VPPPATVTGTIFYDKNDDGIQDTDEPIKAEQTVSLVDCNGEVLQVVLTDTNGNYQFSAVPADTCANVLVGPSSDCTFTADVNSTGSSNTFTLTGGETKIVNAGLYCSAAPVVQGSGTKVNPCVSNDLQNYLDCYV
jgi:hypothetical protein